MTNELYKNTKKDFEKEVDYVNLSLLLKALNQNPNNQKEARSRLGIPAGSFTKKLRNNNIKGRRIYFPDTKENRKMVEDIVKRFSYAAEIKRSPTNYDTLLKVVDEGESIIIFYSFSPSTNKPDINGVPFFHADTYSFAPLMDSSNITKDSFIILKKLSNKFMVEDIYTGDMNNEDLRDYFFKFLAKDSN